MYKVGRRFCLQQVVSACNACIELGVTSRYNSRRLHDQNHAHSAYGPRAHPRGMCLAMVGHVWPMVRCPKPALTALRIACLRYARRHVLTATRIVPNFNLMTAHDGVSVWPLLLNFGENTYLNRKRSIRTHLFLGLPWGPTMTAPCPTNPPWPSYPPTNHIRID